MTVSDYFKAHERLIVVALVLAVGTFGLSKYFDRAATVDSAKAATAEVILQQQITTNAQLASQTAAQIAQYQAMVTQLAQQNASLTAAVAAENAALANRQAVDKTLTPTQLTQRWSVLVPNTAPTPTAHVIPSYNSNRFPC